MTEALQQPAAPALSARLGSVRVGLRADLEVTRHLFRGQPFYIVRDPLTFQSQRLTQADYAVFVAIDAGRSLAEVFAGLVARGRMQADHAEQFYQFVLDLHRLGFLRLPLSDDKLLYRRFKARERLGREAKFKGLLFLRIPLWQPDAFLERTVSYVRPLFSRTFFVLWLLLILSAGYVAARNWDELVEPLQGLLLARNLPLMWLTLIVLKVLHEFGHAYACKHYGGHVPEMGAFLILFTPCAYVDASACWGFTRKRERLVVCLGGMFVESIIAGLAVFVWAATEPSLVHSVAYNVIFLASVVTALFNINPLMRFDGYYILGDLVEIPNLRQRATQHLMQTLKRVLLGLRQPREPGDRRQPWVLLAYGIAAGVYRVTLLIAIVAILASKAFVIGVSLGLAMLVSTLFRTSRRLIRYLWHSEETAGVRGRAVAVGVLGLTLLPAGLVWVPIPSHVHAPAMVTSEGEAVLRVKTPGFLVSASVEPGQEVNAGSMLYELVNESILETAAEARGNLRAAELRRDAFREFEPVRVQQEDAQIVFFQRALVAASERLGGLSVAAPRSGRVIECLRDYDVGRYLREGDPIGLIASGVWRVRAVLTEEQLGRTRLELGDRVEFRPAGGASGAMTGTISRIAPAGSRGVDDLDPLTHLGGGDIAVDPVTKAAAQPYFELTIDLSEADTAALRYGMTGVVSVAATAEPVAKSVGRRTARFWNRLLRG